MTNPWLKKNPFLSMWMSGANSVASAARGQATAAVRRESRHVGEAFASEWLKAWTGGAVAPSPAKRPVKRRVKC